MKMENLKRILDFLEREEVISDYDIENGTFGENEISFVRTIYEEDKIYNRRYIFKEGIDRESFTIKTEIVGKIWYCSVNKKNK